MSPKPSAVQRPANTSRCGAAWLKLAAASMRSYGNAVYLVGGPAAGVTVTPSRNKPPPATLPVAGERMRPTHS